MFYSYLETLGPSITYDSNHTYRNTLRSVFMFDSTKKTYFANLESTDFLAEIDSESRDEMDLDMDALEEGMHLLFVATEHIPAFQELYESAAARMFSTDPKIGQAVLCSYDTFDLYYTCFWHQIITKSDITQLTEYRKLREWFLIK